MQTKAAQDVSVIFLLKTVREHDKCLESVALCLAEILRVHTHTHVTWREVFTSIERWTLLSLYHS